MLKAIKALLLYCLKSEGKISLEQYNRELDEANARIESGVFTTQEDLESQQVSGEIFLLVQMPQCTNFFSSVVRS